MGPLTLGSSQGPEVPQHSTQTGEGGLALLAQSDFKGKWKTSQMPPCRQLSHSHKRCPNSPEQGTGLGLSGWLGPCIPPRPIPPWTLRRCLLSSPGGTLCPHWCFTVPIAHPSQITHVSVQCPLCHTAWEAALSTSLYRQGGLGLPTRPWAPSAPPTHPSVFQLQSH